MSTDPRTIAYYDRVARAYGDVYARVEPDADLLAFMAALSDGYGPILDWGCGVGTTAALLMAKSLDVVATDASAGMVQMARGLGVNVRLEAFDAFVPEPIFRGIWANFSLIHCSRAALPEMISRAAAALLPGGVLHLGMEKGTGEHRDPDGLFTSYWQDAEIDDLVRRAELAPISLRHGTSRKLSGENLSFFIHHSRKPVLS